MFVVGCWGGLLKTRSQMKFSRFDIINYLLKQPDMSEMSTNSRALANPPRIESDLKNPWAPSYLRLFNQNQPYERREADLNIIEKVAWHNEELRVPIVMTFYVSPLVPIWERYFSSARLRVECVFFPFHLCSIENELSRTTWVLWDNNDENSLISFFPSVPSSVLLCCWHCM